MEDENTLAMFLAIFKLSLVEGSVLPFLLSIARLLVILPLANVLGSVVGDVLALSIGSVVLPFADVDITVNVYESAITMSQIVLPVAFVNGPILPDLHSPTTAFVAPPLPLVDIPFFEEDGTLVLCQGVIKFWM